MKCKLLILSLLALSLTACGGSKKLKSNQVQEDITRPPTIAVSEDGSTNESIEKLVTKGNSNESVSYEEWLKENSSKAPVAPKATESNDEGLSYGEQIEKIAPPAP